MRVNNSRLPQGSRGEPADYNPVGEGAVLSAGRTLLKPQGVGQVEAAARLRVSLNRLNEIVLGKRGITTDTALRLRSS